MKSVFGRASKIALVLVSLLFLHSCDQDKIDLSTDDTKNIQNESAMDALFSDSEDLTSVTVSADNALAGGRQMESGRLISVNDPRLACATIMLVPDPATTFQVPKGVLTIDFGTGCNDGNGVTRKGKILIAYNGRRFMPGSSVVTTLDQYQINGVILQGVRSITNGATSSEADPVYTTTMTGGKITWPDGTSASRAETTTREWKLGAAPVDNLWIVNGSATGTNRSGLDFSMHITNQLIYKRSCELNNNIFIAVQGTKDLIVNNKNISVDYGQGTCDNTVDVTIKSRSKSIQLTGYN
jgi:hypothetical protein